MDTFYETRYPCKFGLNYLQNVYTEYSYLLLLNTSKVDNANIKIRKNLLIFKECVDPQEF